jgi:pimeloyl-ACP methyl ester carboxylesterase
MSHFSKSKPSIILVHGAFADATSWQGVIPLLQKDGFTVTAVQNPLNSLAEDVITTRRAIDAQEGDVILVGHSYGGAVITNAATGSEKVKALVYVTGFAPDAGEGLGGLLAKFPPTALATALVPDAAGYLTIDRAKFEDAFAGDLPKGQIATLAATQKPLAAAIFGEPAAEPAWKTIPSWFALSLQDHAIHPDLQRFMAGRMKSTVKEVEASHVSYISQPDKIAAVIKAAVEATLAE